MLYVGTIEERKNLLNIVKAIHNSRIDFPLVVVGKATAYLNRVKACIETYKLRNIYILQNVKRKLMLIFFFGVLFQTLGQTDHR